MADDLDPALDPKRDLRIHPHDQDVLPARAPRHPRAHRDDPIPAEPPDDYIPIEP